MSIILYFIHNVFKEQLYIQQCKMLKYYTLVKYCKCLITHLRSITPPQYASRYIIMTMIMIISSSNRWICMVLDVSLRLWQPCFCSSGHKDGPVVLAEINYLLSPAPALKHTSTHVRTSLCFCSTRETRHVQRDSEFVRCFVFFGSCEQSLSVCTTDCQKSSVLVSV